jgi:hypothetical protein
MVLLFLLENGSAPINSLPELLKSFRTSEFIVFEMNSRLSFAYRPGVINPKTKSCRNSAAEKMFFMSNSTIIFLFLRPSSFGEVALTSARSQPFWEAAIRMPAEGLEIY